MRTSLPVIAASLALACSDGPSSELIQLPVTERPTDAFCVDALRGVDAFMASREWEQSPEHGGTAVLGMTSDAVTMMGFTSATYEAHQHQTFLGLMTLVRYDSELEPEPYLARAWEWNDEGTELTFELRDDVFWHDGTPTTARDVAFTYERVVDPATGFANPTYFANYEGVEVIDDVTVRFHVRPHALPMDTWRATPIMPAHLLEDVPADELADHPYGTVCPVGNGPLRVRVAHTERSVAVHGQPGVSRGVGGEARSGSLRDTRDPRRVHAPHLPPER